MRRLIVVCCGLLLSIAAVGSRAQEVTPKARIDVATPSLPLPAPAPAPAPTAVLPDLRGKTCDQAQAELRRLNLRLTECLPGEARIRYPAGTINAQSVAPGTPISRVDGLRVTYQPGADAAPDGAPRPDSTSDSSRGRNAAAAAAAAVLAAAIADAAAPKLPDLRGMSCDEARAALRSLRISLADCVPGSAGSRYAPGTINAQSEAPGTPATRVKAVRAQTEPSPAPPPEAAQVLPDLRGSSCEQARAALQALGLALVECLPGKAGSRYPAGTISAQSQAPGTPVSRVDRLRARFEPVPTAPEPARLPDLRGKTCDEAAEVLAALKLRYTSCVAGAAVDGASPGRINGQSPDAGSALPLAAPIVLRVQPAPQVIVPALVGLGEAQAASALASRRLQVRASGPAAAQGRRVLSQSPDAGTAVAAGSTVQIALGLSVPRLLDLDCTAARARAAAFGHREFSCESRAAESPDARIGRVFEQAPEEAGAALPAPTAIRVVVWAAQPVTVPDVRERALDEAIGAIEAARLVAQPDQRRGERVVAQQSPAAGTVVDAGSTVRLDTREVVEVPDVVGQTLDAAQQSVRQARLRDGPDAQHHADERIVQSQAPAAHARVAADSLVQLSTKRFATVPDLGGRTCAEARAAVAPDTFALTCNDESSWRVTVFGTPHVVAQRPGARARAEVGTPIAAEARAPLPASLQWLGGVPFVAVAGVAVAPLLGLALWLVRLVPTPPRAPTFEWRVDVDAAPSVSLRWPSAGEAARRISRHPASGMAWRVVPDAGHVLLRESDASSGGKHAHR
jgi:beta-lactam-binding protein with PASTA domain